MWVLILTMAVHSGYAGMGGVITHEFESQKSCLDAAVEWKLDVSKTENVDIDELSAICVKK